DIEIVLKKFLDGHHGLGINGFQDSLFEDLVEKQPTECGGKLIYKTAYSQVIVVNNILVSLENLSDSQRCLGILVGARHISERLSHGSNTDAGLYHELAAQGINDNARLLMDFLIILTLFELFNQNCILVIKEDDIVLRTIGKKALNNIVGIEFTGFFGPNQIDYSPRLGLDSQFLCPD